MLINALWLNAFFVILNECLDIQARVTYWTSLGSDEPVSDALKSDPLSVVLAVLGLVALAGLSLLVTYHYKISLEGLTTHEDVKSVFYGYFVKPYSESLARYSLKNLIKRLTMKVPPPHFRPMIPAPTRTHEVKL